ncbi:phosphotransferase family protein [Nocardia crassostreae]|uniref:phosphotransferase family protein n=1 Tax=Nocardia crassostreae TaxID=53428 RepID=UPI00082A4D35|nr:phosphotransferase [Nocardia crassostreae]
MSGHPPDESITLLADLARQAGAAGDPEVLSGRPDGLVIRVGHLVVKSHPPDTDPAALTTRLRLATHPALHEILVPPIAFDGNLLTARADRLLSLWPARTPIDPDDPAAIPWEQTATLLARLHQVTPSGQGPSVGATLPETGAMARVGRALDRLGAAADVADPNMAGVVWRAAETLPDLGGGARAGRMTLVHGDFHLGQVVGCEGGGTSWRLIDVDDLGLGDPVWDLARFAAYFAAAILDPVVWERFLNAYRRAGGPAVPEGDPWAVLDVPARALVVRAAALAVAKAGLEGRELDEWDVALVDSCRRMRAAVS